MANKLIHYNNKLNFESDKDSITDHSLVFILDSEEIYTHSEIYKGISWSVLKSIITFTVGDLECQAEEGMTWEEWIKSTYNPTSSENVKLFRIYDQRIKLAYDSLYVHSNGASNGHYISINDIITENLYSILP